MQSLLELRTPEVALEALGALLRVREEFLHCAVKPSGRRTLQEDFDVLEAEELL